MTSALPDETRRLTDATGEDVPPRKKTLRDTVAGRRLVFALHTGGRWFKGQGRAR